MNRSIGYIFFISFVSVLSGCVLSSKPDKDSGFADAKRLADFDGCYENCSDVSGGSIASCLSSKVWPGEFETKTIPDEVSVKALSGSELKVSAFRQGEKVKESIFKEGVDFDFNAGRIELSREYAASGASEPGNVFIGLATGKTVLGIDAEGAGRIQQSTSAMGTAFLIIPVAVSGTDVSKIKRKGSDCYR